MQKPFQRNVKNINASNQADEMDEFSQHISLSALCLIARMHQVVADPVTLAHSIGKSASEKLTLADIRTAAESIGLRAYAKKIQYERLQDLPHPLLVLINEKNWVVLGQCDRDRVLLQSPGSSNYQQPTIISSAEFIDQWCGRVILIKSLANTSAEVAAFDFTWFVPCMVKYRRLLSEVLLISIFLQLFSLVSPLLFQVVTDKVLVHHGANTLDVMVVGLVIIVTFESILTALRSYIFSHTTSRIDVELGTKLFRHLLSLPLAYFEARRVGDSITRARELETLREFITGNALTLILDVIFSTIFIAVMFFYSVQLTLIVLVSLPIYFSISFIVVPILRVRLLDRFAKNAENQSLLVETVSGIQTVKAGALEPLIANRWDRQLAEYISSSFKAQNLAMVAHECINLTGKLVQAATLWYGSHLVMDGGLTVGMFVAFNMFAQRVAQPIIRIAQMWSDFQQAGISMARLGDILNTRSENVNKASPVAIPSIKGDVRFKNIGFRYRPDSKLILDNFNFTIAPGEMVGIVGRSGSGKSTITKLVQRLYTADSGNILIDGVDISLVDSGQLRRQIGVVLQDNCLFNRTIRENISITDPGAPIELVIRVARLAGAHEFISELEHGYETIIGEQGIGLSGGQRQRIAIARALFSNPRILIFDEATSALDYESEAVIQENMKLICKGRTVIIIAHRLSSVRECNRIIVMEKGAIAEHGSHESLLAMPLGLYSHLWKMQAGVRVMSTSDENSSIATSASSQ